LGSCSTSPASPCALARRSTRGLMVSQR
jgi:hypothetical protein